MYDDNLYGSDDSRYHSDDKIDDGIIDVEASETSSDSDSGEYSYSFRNQNDGSQRYHYDGGSQGDSYYSGGRRNNDHKKGGKFAAKVVASGLVFGLVAGCAFSGVNMVSNQIKPSQKIDATLSTSDTKTDTSKSTGSGTTTTDVSAIVSKVMPAVVSITCEIESSGNFFTPSQETEGAGSGFIISQTKDKILIATNNHVVNGAKSLTVGFNDGKTVNAQIVGTDSDSDLAVISVNTADMKESTLKSIKIATLGSSDNLEVGQSVIAIGNALGYGQSVTTGVVSATNRKVSFQDGTMTLIQTDAAINPGNSGGVLINTNGEVVGINNAKLADTSVEGMGYAIPISKAKEELTDLMNSSNVSAAEAGYLGIYGRTIDSGYAQAYSLPNGIYVVRVVKGSPAEKAGLSAGDIIVEFEGNSVSTMEGLQSKIARKKAGTKVSITVKRADQNGTYKKKTLEVKLGKKSEADTSTESKQSQNQNGQNSQNNQNGQNSQNSQNNQNGQSDQNGQNNQNNNNGSSQYGYGNDNSEQTDPFEYFFGDDYENQNNENPFFYNYNNQ